MLGGRARGNKGITIRHAMFNLVPARLPRSGGVAMRLRQVLVHDDPAPPSTEVAPGVVEFEVAVPRLTPALR